MPVGVPEAVPSAGVLALPAGVTAVSPRCPVTGRGSSRPGRFAQTLRLVSGANWLASPLPVLPVPLGASRPLD